MASPLPAPAPAPLPTKPMPAEATPAPPAQTAAARVPRRVKLGPAAPVRSHDELKRQMARRLVATHPEESYESRAPQVLLAVPVLQIELQADGSVRRVIVLREPHQARETVQMAIDAVRRAAPFGSVQALKQPWVFTESFLFDYDKRFKPRTLE